MYDYYSASECMLGNMVVGKIGGYVTATKHSKAQSMYKIHEMFCITRCTIKLDYVLTWRDYFFAKSTNINIHRERTLFEFIMHAKL